MKSRTTIVARWVLATLGVVGVTYTGSALADHPHGNRYRHYQYDEVDYARVVDVEPIIRRVRISRPEQQCWNEERPVYGGGGRTVARSTIVGGLIGAAVGHHIGHHHHGHNAGAVIGGSLVGAAIGNAIGTDSAARRGEYRQVGYDSVQRCQVSYRDEWEERVDGYRVTYAYRGRHYTTRMPYDPGHRVRVNIDVRPGYEY